MVEIQQKWTELILTTSHKKILTTFSQGCTTLIQWNKPLGAEWQRVCRFAPGSGQNVPIPYFFVFAISQEYNYICLHFVIEYMYCHSLKIPAKYYDNRLNMFNVGSISLSYAILPQCYSEIGKYMKCIRQIYQIYTYVQFRFGCTRLRESRTEFDTYGPFY